ncbi:Meckel syndrome type 1 protein [Sitophilus oryzae]|uniref:Meckel syndrome type 1 protein n=1 Tax=Sitophilus oryzae TaxID=7048 RepID=A0A6J2X9J2_SITOR|nr:Meckel syndrome type 1 protein [Sitophilus oryzae]
MEYVDENIPKSSGFYRCPDDIKYFKVKIKIIQLTEDKTNNERMIEKEFSWQEKQFSEAQKHFYGDEKNCLTETEKEFHKLVNELDESKENDILFSYINLEEEIYQKLQTTNRINYLENAIERLEMEHCLDDNEYNFHKSLQKSMDFPVLTERTETMLLMLDLGNYSENTGLKNEKILCSIKYNPDTKLLTVFPDFTTTQPYFLRTDVRDDRNFCYFIEHSSKPIPESIEVNEKTLIKKINDYRKFTTSHILRKPFELPPKNKLFVFVFLEIVSGKKFEYPNVYVQYFIDLPDRWFCPNPELLRGRTQICKAINQDGLLHFGHCVELTLEYNFLSVSGTEFIKPPYIYFEVISKDWWDRYRTEGLTYRNLPICTSGTFGYNLNCFRFTSRDPGGEMRRYFLGDCQNYDDVTWIGLPTDYNEKVLNKYGTETIGTGQLDIRLNLVHQSQAFLEEDRLDADKLHHHRRKMISEKLESSALIKSVEQVIREFKKAKKHLLEVRENVAHHSRS